MGIKKDIIEQKLKESSKSIIKTFLEGIYFCMEATGELHVSRFSVYHSMRKKAFSDWSDTDFSRQISNAARSGYLKITPNDSIAFTGKAKLKIVDAIVADNQDDNKIRFISFDIPEKMRPQRDSFRRTIKNLGFRQIQKSLWACDKNIGDLVEIAMQESDVAKYAAYIVSERSDIDFYLRKKLRE